MSLNHIKQTVAMTDPQRAFIKSADLMATGGGITSIVPTASASNFTLTAPAATGTIALSSQIPEVPLTIAHGGTNSTNALANSKLMVSSAGAIVEGTSSSTPTFTSLTLGSGTALQTYQEATQVLTLTNAVTGSPTVTATFVKVGKLCTIKIPSVTGSASAQANITLTTISNSAFFPSCAAEVDFPVRVVNNSASPAGSGMLTITNTGTMFVWLDWSKSNAFAGTGNNGWAGDIVATYHTASQ